MELRQLRYFVEVARIEHFSKAAESLHIAQSALSRQVGLLEKELGVELFEREGRNVKLTFIGKMFLEQAILALKAVDNASRLVEEYLEPERGIIRIGFPSSIASSMLPSIISAFKKEHPDVRFHLKQASYDTLTEGIKKREIDLAFIGPVPANDPELHAHILFSENFLAMLSDTHSLAEFESLSLNQLEPEPFVLFPEGFMLRQIVVDACVQAGFQPSIPYEGEDLDAIKGLVSSGIGVTLLPETTLFGNLPEGLKKIKITYPDVKRSVGLIIPKNRKLSPSENLFYEFVLEYFRHLNMWT
ncbi:LysR family transcriptional regulator [Falsibacillus pallidus]|uniref:LysR family transcriptional activator of glutamate synthase operon n=1 Tax=Falsibacillus pallidus TaxID=493781 RepID=A0A370GDI8_9BACI|nr:LysR family transcriptional regulator [Falsibacillus pallidus]RDI41858.1 LysR family transcriptional activator of glutamate synthase operon [Falsibacillus pallidus]